MFILIPTGSWSTSLMDGSPALLLRSIAIKRQKSRATSSTLLAAASMQLQGDSRTGRLGASPTPDYLDHFAISPIPLPLLRRLNALDQSPIYDSVEIPS